MASDPIFKTSCLCHSGVQVRPASSLFHTPPPAAPAQIMFGWVGWAIAQVMRPPIFVGPANCHSASDDTGDLPFALRRSVAKRSIDASRYGQDARACNQRLRPLWG